jgi:hypothetical protein
VANHWFCPTSANRFTRESCGPTICKRASCSAGSSRKQKLIQSEVSEPRNWRVFPPVYRRPVA